MDVTRRLFVAGSVVPMVGGAAGLASAQPTPDGGRAIPIPDVAALRDLPPQSSTRSAGETPALSRDSGSLTGPPRVVVQGHQTPDDGGGGEFYWDAQSEAADDNGVIIKPRGVEEPGRWRRIITDSINVRWFGARADGTGNAAAAINEAIIVAARLNLPLLLSGSFRLEQSIVLAAPVTIQAAATLIAASGTYNSIPYWSGESSGRFCLIDLAYGRFSSIVGRLVLRPESKESPPAALAAIGCSKGIYSELLPNPEGRGGSNTTWQSVEIYDLDYGFFTPERGAPVPSQLPKGDVHLARADWQASAVARGDGTYAALSYRQGDFVLFGRDVFECVSPGTPTTGPVDAAPKAAAPSLNQAAPIQADNWEYLSDEQMPGIPRWVPNQAIAANTLITTDTGTYRARRNGQTGGTPPEQKGVVVKEAEVPVWSAGDTPMLLSFRANNNRFYRLVTAGKETTVGPGPDHTDGRPVSDANGWAWAYAGPAVSPQWQYRRKLSYCAAGTGMVIGHFWTQNVASPWTGSATATDDSFITHFRAQSCRDTAIRNNGANFAAANVYIHGFRGRFASATDDDGSAAIQNFGVYRVDSTYIDGEWTRGIVLGQDSDTETTFKADGGFKTATGVAIEPHPQATHLTARFRSASINAHQPIRDYAYIDTRDPFNPGETITGPHGKAIVLSSHGGQGDAPTLVIYRLEAGEFLVGDHVVSNRAQGQIIAPPDPRANTLSLGLVGIPTAIAGTTRQIDVELMGSTGEIFPYRALGRPPATTYETRDYLIARASDGRTLYCFRSSVLARSVEDGYANLGNVANVVDIDPTRGSMQFLTIAAPGGQLRLPSTALPSARAAKRGCRLQLEIANPGLASALFFTDETHPPPNFIGGQPNWPKAGVVVLHLWIYNSEPWRAIVLAGDQRTHTIPANGFRPTGVLIESPPSSTSPGYRYALLPADDQAKTHPVWFDWIPPDDWDRGPIKFRYRWTRSEGKAERLFAVSKEAYKPKGLVLNMLWAQLWYRMTRARSLKRYTYLMSLPN